MIDVLQLIGVLTERLSGFFTVPITIFTVPITVFTVPTQALLRE
jgi:hypothetical protein